jgi:hypothetical protein
LSPPRESWEGGGRPAGEELSGARRRPTHRAEGQIRPPRQARIPPATVPLTLASVEDGPFAIKGSPLSFVVDWTSGSHTSVPMPVPAEGPGADLFSGQHPNTFVHDVLSRILS